MTLRSFDSRPLHERAKVMVPLVGSMLIVFVALFGITFCAAPPDILQHAINWVAALCGGGGLGIAVDDALTKPHLARRRAARPPAPPPET